MMGNNRGKDPCLGGHIDHCANECSDVVALDNFRTQRLDRVSFIVARLHRVFIGSNISIDC